MGRRTQLRDLFGVLKDKASLSKVAFLSKSKTSSLQLAVLRVTTHEPSSPPEEKHIDALLSFGHSSRITASACIEALMDRLQNTHNSFVAFKCLIVVHHIIRRGSFILQDQISIYPSTGGRNYLNLSNFRDNSSPETWELSSWVRWYASFLEFLLVTSRVLGFFLCCSSTETREEEEKMSALLNGDLLKELDALVGLVEEICRAPEMLNVRGKKFFDEAMSLVGQDYYLAQKEIVFRLNELRERLGCLSFSESIELVCVLKKLKNCKERLLELFLNKKGTLGDVLWGLIGEMKEKIAKENACGDGKLLMVGWRDRASESARFVQQTVRLDDSVRFSSGRFDKDRLPLPLPFNRASDPQNNFQD